MDLSGISPAPPQAPAPAAIRPEAPSDPAAGEPVPVDVLLVDDDDRNLRALHALLSEVPARLTDARSGEEALRCLLQRDFALILMDVQMPGLNGLETAALVRQRDRSRYTPIIFLTAFSRTDEQLVDAYRLGAIDFLTKPIVPLDVLKGKVGWFVDLYRMKALLERERERARAAELREHERAVEAARREGEQLVMRRDMEEQRALLERLQATNERLESLANEREQLIAELRRRADDLAESDRRKDELLAMLAHELRNPLAPVLHAVELLRQERADPRTCGRALEAADRQVHHMARLVDDLVDVSRIRTGKVALHREPVPLSEVLEPAMQALEPLLQERHHFLAVDLPEAPVWLDADAVRLAQVIENLLHNAAKYTDEGGHLRLVAERRGEWLVVRVGDDGIGIPADVLPRVFDVFVQGEQPPDRARGGLGLGLALVKSIVEMHGGTVEVRSDGPGRGTEVTVCLPTVSPPAGEARAGDGAERAGEGPPRNGHATAAPSPPRPSPRPLRIAIAEDNPDVRETLGQLLAARGHVVLQAEDGPGAVELVVAEHPDVALLDIGLPGLDGYEVAARVRASAPSTRLVAVTGYGRADDRQRALDAGFDAHLVKPVDLAELNRILERL